MSLSVYRRIASQNPMRLVEMIAEVEAERDALKEEPSHDS